MIGVVAMVLLVVALGATLGRFTALPTKWAAALVAAVAAALTVLVTGEFLPDAWAIVGMLLVALAVAWALASAGAALGRWRQTYLERIA